jgi:hypothetical protein
VHCKLAATAITIVLVIRLDAHGEAGDTASALAGVKLLVTKNVTSLALLFIIIKLPN